VVFDKKEYMKEYHSRPEVREQQKEYYARPEVKERKKEYSKEYNKEYNSRPEVKERKKEYSKEYHSRPEVREQQKEYRKEYFSRPEVIEYRKEYSKEYYARPEVIEQRKEYKKEYNSRPEVKEYMKEYNKEYMKEYATTISYKLSAAKGRAKKKNLEFNLTVEYLESIYPENNTCPLLNIPLDWYSDTKHPTTPSMDRIDSSKGYIKGNVQWVSYRANTLKGDGTPDELLMLAQNYKKISDKL